MRGLIVLAGALCMALAGPVSARTAEQTADAALRAAPVWDGHNDVPIQLRGRFGNVISGFDFHDTTNTGSSPRRNCSKRSSRCFCAVRPVTSGAANRSATRSSWSRNWPITRIWSPRCCATSRSSTDSLAGAVAAMWWRSGGSASA